MFVFIFRLIRISFCNFTNISYYTLERVLKPKIPPNYHKFADNRTIKKENLWGILVETGVILVFVLQFFCPIDRIFEVLRHTLINKSI